MKGTKKEIVKRIARNRIIILLKNVERIFLENNKLGQRYIEIIRKLSRKYRVKIPYEYKMRICNHCKSFLWPGVNCRVRIRKDNKNLKITTTCFECNRQMRFIYQKKREANNEKIRKNEDSNQ